PLARGREEAFMPALQNLNTPPAIDAPASSLFADASSPISSDESSTPLTTTSTEVSPEPAEAVAAIPAPTWLPSDAITPTPAATALAAFAVKVTFVRSVPSIPFDATVPIAFPAESVSTSPGAKTPFSTTCPMVELVAKPAPVALLLDRFLTLPEAVITPI